jgi:hypothetical protein
MSYEFSIVFETKEAMQEVMQRLKESQLVNCVSQNSVTLKDPKLASRSPYDIGFSSAEESQISVDLMFKTNAIYLALVQAIGATAYVCIGDCDEEVGLREIFKIRSL